MTWLARVGRCPVCWQVRRVTDAGKMYRHGQAGRTGLCDGSDRAPAVDGAADTLAKRSRLRVTPVSDTEQLFYFAPTDTPGADT